MDIEPYPVERNAPFWEEGGVQWLERYEYIEARAQAYLEAYQADPDYDFTRQGGAVLNQQRATIHAYEQYACGAMSLLGVQAQVKMLRFSFKKKEATPYTPEERAKLHEKPAYVPDWRKEWEAKKAAEREAQKQAAHDSQPSPDKTAFITRRAYSMPSPEASPMPGLACYCTSRDEGYLSDGTRVESAEAYLHILWDQHEFYYPDQPGRPDILIPGYKAEATPEVEKAGTLDDLKQKQRAAEHQKDLDKLEKKLKRGRKG